MNISVIIPTRNRAYCIVSCLSSVDAALRQAKLQNAEIIVVNNNSSDSTTAVTQLFAQTAYASVQVINELTKGAANARNTGIRSAKGDVLVFTDDDCRLGCSYFQELIGHFNNDRRSLVIRGGRVELGDKSDLPITTLTGEQIVTWSRAKHSARHENIGNALFSCNMALTRAALNQIGLFDPNLGVGASIPAGEDTDYIYRAYLSDVTIEYVPDMTVYHFHGRKHPKEGYALFRNYSIGGGALYAKYLFKDPNLCKQFLWDLKGAFNEVLHLNNSFMPAIGFSHKSKVFYAGLGAIRYFWGAIWR